jgi:hypothetical protein
MSMPQSFARNGAKESVFDSVILSLLADRSYLDPGGRLCSSMRYVQSRAVKDDCGFGNASGAT